MARQGRGSLSINNHFRSFAEFRHPQVTEQNYNSSFPGTCASEMTLLVTDRATFLQESSPGRHATSLSEKANGLFRQARAPWARLAPAPKRKLAFCLCFASTRPYIPDCGSYSRCPASLSHENRFSWEPISSPPGKINLPGMKGSLEGTLGAPWARLAPAPKRKPAFCLCFASTRPYIPDCESYSRCPASFLLP